MIHGSLDFFSLLTQLPSQNPYQKGTEDYYWYQVLVQAYQGWGWSAPNPSVGALIIPAQEDLAVMSGYHAKTGEPHGEIQALNQIGPLSRHATQGWELQSEHLQYCQQAQMLVTLEPCAHQGRTPSCAETLARLPFGEVCYLLKDPNPLVAGRGHQILQAAGIRVRCLEDEQPNSMWVTLARRIHQFFLHQQVTQRPFITIKIASSLDGGAHLKNGDSQWITSRSSRTLARAYRGLHQAIWTTAATLLADNPRLDFRQTPFEGKPSQLWIWDRSARLLGQWHLEVFNRARCEANFQMVWCVEGQDPQVLSSLLSSQGLGSKVKVESCPPIADWELWLKLWHRYQVQSLWVEGGPRFTSALLQAQKVDEVQWYQAPIWMGDTGVRWTEGVQVYQLRQAHQQFHIKQAQVLPEGDVLWSLRQPQLYK